MKDNYTPGQDCNCHAYGENECGCDADWTPSEVYELREKLAAERALADRLAGALEMMRDADDDCHKDGLQTILPVARHKIDLSLTAWKEARSE